MTPSMVAVLSDAAALTRFDLHHLDQSRAIMEAMLSHPPSGVEREWMASAAIPREELAALSASAAVPVPAMQALSPACRGPALQATPARADACRRVADVMRSNSDTVLGESFGVSMTRRLAATADAIADVDAQGRRFAWRTQQMGTVTAAQPRYGMPEFVRLLADKSIRDERQLAKRVLAGAGVPLEPPTDWQPPRRD